MATRADFIQALRYEVGTVEQPANSNCQPYSHELGRPCESWCADFLAAIAKRVGLDVPSHAAYTPSLAGAFKAANQWHVDGPEPGDYVFYDFPDAIDRIQHVGVVVGVEPMLIHTVEGNTSSDQHGSQFNGGGVYERTRHRDHTIVGYGRPLFDHAVPPLPKPPHTEDNNDMTIWTLNFDKTIYVQVGSTLRPLTPLQDAELRQVTPALPVFAVSGKNAFALLTGGLTVLASLPDA